MESKYGFPEKGKKVITATVYADAHWSTLDIGPAAVVFDHACSCVVTRFVSHAAKTIDVIAFQLDGFYTGLLLAAMRNGVRVRILKCGNTAGSYKVNWTAMKELFKASVCLKVDSKLEIRYGRPPTRNSFSLIHEKTWILDDVIVLTGSHNLSHHSARYNRENLVIIAEDHAVLRERARFRDLWSSDATPAEASDSWIEERDIEVDSVGLSCHFGPAALRASPRSRRSRSESRSQSAARSSGSSRPAGEAEAVDAKPVSEPKSKGKSSRKRAQGGDVPPPAPVAPASLAVWSPAQCLPAEPQENFALD